MNDRQLRDLLTRAAGVAPDSPDAALVRALAEAICDITGIDADADPRYATDTGDRLIEHYAAQRAQKFGITLPTARKIVSTDPAYNAVLGREPINGDAHAGRLHALVEAGIATPAEQAAWNTWCDASTLHVRP